MASYCNVAPPVFTKTGKVAKLPTSMRAEFGALRNWVSVVASTSWLIVKVVKAPMLSELTVLSPTTWMAVGCGSRPGAPRFVAVSAVPVRTAGAPEE